MLRIDEDGFDDFDRQYLRSIIYDFAGGPVGIESLAASLGHDRDTRECCRAVYYSAGLRATLKNRSYSH